MNGNALCRLSATNENNTFNKRMVVQAGSIVEAALDQIIYRIRNHTREGVPNIPVEDWYKIRGTKIERELRDRVHIQFDDEPEGLGRDDHLAFSTTEVIWSLSLCIRVLKHLGERFPLPEELGVFAHNVPIPKA